MILSIDCKRSWILLNKCELLTVFLENLCFWTDLSGEEESSGAVSKRTKSKACTNGAEFSVSGELSKCWKLCAYGSSHRYSKTFLFTHKYNATICLLESSLVLSSTVWDVLVSLSGVLLHLIVFLCCDMLAYLLRRALMPFLILRYNS